MHVSMSRVPGQQQSGDHGSTASGSCNEALQGDAATYHAQCKQRSRLHQWHGSHGARLQKCLKMCSCPHQDRPTLAHLSHHRLGEGGWLCDGVPPASWICFNNSQVARGRARAYHGVARPKRCAGGGVRRHQQSSARCRLSDRRDCDPEAFHSSHVKSSGRQPGGTSTGCPGHCV